MKTADLKSRLRFSPDKMSKNEVLATNRMAVDLYCFEGGQAQRSHKHTDMDKTYYVIQGKGRFSVGRTTREIGEGMFVLAPAGEEHGVVNMSENQLILLVFSAPPAEKT